MEQIINNAVSSLTAAISSSDTTIQVQTGSLFPSTGNFRLRVDTELMLCTARSGDNLTVTRAIESSAAAAHSSNASVACILTSGGIAQYVSDSIAEQDLGTAAYSNVGTAANEVVQLDDSGLLPAVDGSQLTNLPSGGGASLPLSLTSGDADVVLQDFEGNPLIQGAGTQVVNLANEYVHFDGGNTNGSIGQVNFNADGSVSGITSLSTDGGAITTDGSGNLTAVSLELSGSIAVHSASTLDNEAITTDGSGNLVVSSINCGARTPSGFDAGQITTDGAGNLTLQTLISSNISSDVYGRFSSDGGGNITACSLNVSSLNGGPAIKIVGTGLLSSPTDGSLEYDGSHLYFTIGSTRHTLI